MEFLRERRIAKLKAKAAYQTAFADALEKQIREFGQASAVEIEQLCKARAKAAAAKSSIDSLRGFN